jgi:hypothetical protein
MVPHWQSQWHPDLHWQSQWHPDLHWQSQWHPTPVTKSDKGENWYCKKVLM